MGCSARNGGVGHAMVVRVLVDDGRDQECAEEFAAEFVSRLVDDRPAMRAVALTTDTSILTAVANDYGFERLFARQIEVLGQAGDVFLAISTSGNSPNILRALVQCRDLGLVTIGLTGRTGGKMPPLCDYCLRVPSEVTMCIHQAHLALEHIFSLLVERRYFAAKPAAKG